MTFFCCRASYFLYIYIKIISHEATPQWTSCKEGHGIAQWSMFLQTLHRTPNVCDSKWGKVMSIQDRMCTAYSKYTSRSQYCMVAFFFFSPSLHALFSPSWWWVCLFAVEFTQVCKSTKTAQQQFLNGLTCVNFTAQISNFLLVSLALQKSNGFWWIIDMIGRK